MDFNIDVRRKQLESLKQYINSSKDKVQSIVKRLGWRTKSLLEHETPMINCSVNAGHRVAYHTSEDHFKKCAIKTMGYKLDEQFLSEPSSSSSTSTVKIDYHKKVEILSHARWFDPHFRPAWTGQENDPLTVDRLISTFSPDERLAFYNFCVASTQKPPVPQEFDVTVTNDKPSKDGHTELAYEELLAFERDVKRRRIKYKSVHTNRKSYKEVIREVIENQMDLYREWIEQKETPAPAEKPVDRISDVIKSEEPEKKSKKDGNYRAKSPRRSSSRRKSRERDKSRQSSRSVDSRNGRRPRTPPRPRKRRSRSRSKSRDRKSNRSRSRDRSRHYRDRRR